MINVHPQRWNDEFVPWARELVWQNVKNVVKRIIIHRLPRLNKCKKGLTGQAQINADYLISRRHTPVPSAGATGQAQTFIRRTRPPCLSPPGIRLRQIRWRAGFTGQKVSSLREWDRTIPMQGHFPGHAAETD